MVWRISRKTTVALGVAQPLTQPVQVAGPEIVLQPDRFSHSISMMLLTNLGSSRSQSCDAILNHLSDQAKCTIKLLKSLGRKLKTLRLISELADITAVVTDSFQIVGDVQKARQFGRSILGSPQRS